MATYSVNGSGSVGNQYRLDLIINETPDNNTNKSNLSCTAQIVKVSGSGYYSGNTGTYSFTVGDNQFSGTFSGYNFANYTTLTIASNVSFSQEHDASGAKTISISGSVVTNTSSLGTFTISGQTMTLTTIPRASSISITSNYSIANTTGNVGYTITPKRSAYHKVIWTLNGSSTTVNKTTAISSATSYTDITNALMLNKMSNVVSATLTVTLKTYSDSALTNQIGSDSVASCNVSINTTTIKPSISISALGYNSGTNLSGILIAGYTTAEATYTSSTSAGATSTIKWSTSHSTISNGVTGTLPSSASDYTLSVTATITDSRGVSASANKTASVKGYTPPQLSLNAYRCDANGNQDMAGAKMYVTCSNTISLSTQGNSVQSSVQNRTYSSGTSSTFANATIYNCTTDESCTLTYTITDKFTSSTKTLVVQVASYPLDLYQDGNNIGVGLCTQASSNRINIGKMTYMEMASGGVHYNAKRTDTGTSVWMGVGSGGVNHGLWSDTLGNWICYSDGTNNVFRGNATSATSATSATNADKAKELSLYATRGNSTNLNTTIPTGGGGLYRLVSTSSTTTGKPPTDGNVLQMNWDGTNGWDSQLCIANTDDANQRMFFRSQRNATWNDWEEIVHTTKSTALGSNIQPVYVDKTGKLIATYSSTTEATLTKSSGNCTFTYYMRNAMGMVFLSISMKTTASISAGSNIFVGTLSGWKPNSSGNGATGGTYYSGTCQGGYINTSGTVTIRACSTIPSGAEVIISFYYYS